MSDGYRLIWAASTLALLMARFFPFELIPLISCPLKTFTYVPCPACGMTRAFMHFVRGDFQVALRVSPLGTLLACAAVAVTIYGALRFTIVRRGWEMKLTRMEATIARIGVVAAVLINWVYLIVSGVAA